MMVFDCPEITLCGWQDIKIRLPIYQYNNSSRLVTFCVESCKKKKLRIQHIFIFLRVGEQFSRPVGHTIIYCLHRLPESVQVSLSTDRIVRGTWWTIQQRSSSHFFWMRDTIVKPSVTTASPKHTFNGPWRADDVVMGRGDARWTTSKRQRVDSPAHARIVHNGLLQKRLEKDLCWIVSRVPTTATLVKGLNWIDREQFQHVKGCPLFDIVLPAFPLRFALLFTTSKVNWRTASESATAIAVGSDGFSSSGFRQTQCTLFQCDQTTGKWVDVKLFRTRLKSFSLG